MGRGCNARPSRPMRCGFNCMHSPTTLATSFARWRYRAYQGVAKVVSGGGYVAFEMAEVAIPRQLRQKQDARSACGATTPGRHRQSIRAETATQNPCTP